jgi:2-polyprenyl-3-methyl-5-hydroxy-6-metoxy-1,4-benzoquinol methylase
MPTSDNDKMGPPAPQIVNQEEYSKFQKIVIEANLDPNNRWIRDYVDITWRDTRPFLRCRRLPNKNASALEFGCNIGAGSIMLAAMGARVTAIDIDPAYVGISQANAKAYGLDSRIDFQTVPDTRKLPYASNAFDMVVCNSVLEYVAHDHLPDVLAEIDRVLKPGGVLFILGTSSRLWPKDIHSGTWFVNYLPHRLDPWLRRLAPDFERGVNPWRIFNHLQGYVNLDLEDSGASFINAKRATSPAWKVAIFRLLNLACVFLNTSLGTLLPSMTCAMRKKQHDDAIAR